MQAKADLGERGAGVCTPSPFEMKPSSYPFLKFVHLTSQLRHSLVVAPTHPPKQKSWIHPCYLQTTLQRANCKGRHQNDSGVQRQILTCVQGCARPKLRDALSYINLFQSLSQRLCRTRRGGGAAKTKTFYSKGVSYISLKQNT